MKLLELLEYNENGAIPSKFWLVFDIPTYDDARQQQVISALKSHELHGIKGISGSKRIVLNFLGIARNALLVMNPSEFLRINPKVKKIEYTNPKHLLENNMKLLYRIFSKSSDRKYDRIGVWTNIGDYIARWCKKHGHFAMANELAYGPIGEKIGYYYNDNLKDINNLDDLADVFLNGIKYNDKFEPYKKEMLLEFFTPNLIKKILYDVLVIIGEVYSDEDEWFVDSDSLKTPTNSLLVVGINPKMKKMWEDWKNDKIDGPALFMNEKYILEFDRLMQSIDELKASYNIKLADMVKFDSVRTKILSK